MTHGGDTDLAEMEASRAQAVTAAEFATPRPFEKLSVDRGVLFKAFDDVDEAQAWLGRITN